MERWISRRRLDTVQPLLADGRATVVNEDDFGCTVRFNLPIRMEWLSRQHMEACREKYDEQFRTGKAGVIENDFPMKRCLVGFSDAEHTFYTAGYTGSLDNA